jgi:uncharacterized ubiquitin-like protein YukD
LADQTAINIGLHINDQVIDLRIPRLVNEQQLKKVLTSSLETLSIHLPREWELKLLNKNIEINKLLPLSEYPLSDGDQLWIGTKIV